MFTLHPQAKAYCPRGKKKSVGSSRKQATRWRKGDTKEVPLELLKWK